ncbi:hypothetical protein AVEN_122334-1 [Araneus ventricosus]|uniref:BZIP domain-containing protein n=1 Tax=Araneus ventricosus TaxID=182803 RepID=A0A4Y2WTE4_ARAVE|nr:hypothetical protein AVEN_122334-1 [Araneus ventricosus]
MSQRSDLLKWRRNRAAAQRQISEEEKKERTKQLRKERAKRYYEKNKQKKKFIPNYFQINDIIRSKPGSLNIDSVLYIAGVRYIYSVYSILGYTLSI